MMRMSEEDVHHFCILFILFFLLDCDVLYLLMFVFVFLCG